MIADSSHKTPRVCSSSEFCCACLPRWNTTSDFPQFFVCAKTPTHTHPHTKNSVLRLGVRFAAYGTLQSSRWPIVSSSSSSSSSSSTHHTRRLWSHAQTVLLHSGADFALKMIVNQNLIIQMCKIWWNFACLFVCLTRKFKKKICTTRGWVSWFFCPNACLPVFFKSRNLPNRDYLCHAWWEVSEGKQKWKRKQIEFAVCWETRNANLI